MCVCVCIYICIYIYIYIYMCVCVCVCVNIYMYIIRDSPRSQRLRTVGSSNCRWVNLNPNLYP